MIESLGDLQKNIEHHGGKLVCFYGKNKDVVLKLCKILDPASNNGNWQWVASTGADSQPYFRIFSPWSQSKRFDNDGEYIKQWVPELKEVAAKDLHEWNTSHKKYPSIHYHSPIVDYSEQRKKALKLYSDALQ